VGTWLGFLLDQGDESRDVVFRGRCRVYVDLVMSSVSYAYQSCGR
jgi:hypothetical protein